MAKRVGLILRATWFSWFAGLALVLVSGGMQGVLTERWHARGVLQEALNRVPQVPYRMGSWQGQDLEADPLPFRQARVDRYWVRRYEDTEHGTVCVAILMCGRAGPLAVHTPEVCYRGAGYQMQGSASRLTLSLPDGATAQLWTAYFRREQAGTGPPLRLFWGWSADGNWQAPHWPRWTFAGHPFLYKLYVIREQVDTAGPPTQDPGVDFLTALLPVLRQVLFPSASPAKEPQDARCFSAPTVES